MVIDSSAIVAIATGEAVAERLLRAMHAATSRRISHATLLESCIILAGRFGEAADRDLDTLVRRLQLEEVDVDLEQARLAREAAIRYGRSRHRAALNFGDCFSYALAMQADDELLFTGADFSQTDVRVATY
jgi:ribonuclease VapC